MERKLIESDINYRRVKTVILYHISIDGETPFFTEDEWKMMFPAISLNKFRHTILSMLEDTELRRECDRDSVSTRYRWVLRKERK
ncbi:MAG: hypothetical protein LBJ67_05720 [Planctomycetaceae bacterium]|jgi:hypothetical protein|nr:hypothetical protein [Planctomycetaceae bacterium]